MTNLISPLKFGSRIIYDTSFVLIVLEITVRQPLLLRLLICLQVQAKINEITEPTTRVTTNKRTKLLSGKKRSIASKD